MNAILQKRSLCDLCGTCVAVCPTDAIKLSEIELTIDDERCTMCLNCVHVCPVKALEVVHAEAI